MTGIKEKQLKNLWNRMSLKNKIDILQSMVGENFFNKLAKKLRFKIIK
jgi:hypothetical protein